MLEATTYIVKGDDAVVLKRMLDAYADEVIATDQVYRIIDSVLKMIGAECIKESRNGKHCITRESLHTGESDR